MNLVLPTFAAAVAAGYLARGRLSALGRLRLRWQAAAIVGLGLQVAPIPGKTLALALLFTSFGVLIAFGIVNIRVAGFPLILIGIALNLTVISVDHGMPVTRHALVASGQQETLSLLRHDGGAKHHLATSSDRVLFLGDVIPIAPIHQAVSVGDVFTYLGVCWLIIAGMLSRCARWDGDSAAEARVPSHGDAEHVRA